ALPAGRCGAVDESAGRDCACDRGSVELAKGCRDPPAIPWSRGLSRRRLGWRGDLCAVVPAASGTGVRSSGWSSSTSREFLRVYPERFAKQHGPLRPVVERVLRGFL